MSTVPISGNTYPVKDALKALGGKWDANEKVWRVPEEKAAEAEKLVLSVPDRPRFSKKRFGNGYGRRPKCPQCGRVSDGGGKSWECGEPCGD